MAIVDREVCDAVVVRFRVEGREICGRVIVDAPGFARTKIVFMARNWLGPEPKDGEDLQVWVVHETKPENSGCGVLFVARVNPHLFRRAHQGHTLKCPACGRLTVRALESGRFLRHGTCSACGTFYLIDHES